MGSIFDQCNGVGVLRVSNCTGATTATITPAIAIQNFTPELPITGFTLDLGTNHQFLHTLDEFIYLYAFGDRIGELTLTGVSFAETCVSDAGGRPLTDAMLPKNILSYYHENRVSREGGPVPAYITIGGADKVLLGFLTGMRLDLPNPAMPIVQWALRYNVVLTKTGLPPYAKRTATSAAPTAPVRPSGRWPVSPNTLPSIPWNLIPQIPWPSLPPLIIPR